MRRLLLLALVLFILSPAAMAAETRTFFAMDTYMSISAPSADEGLIDRCISEVEYIESLISVTDTSSEIYRLNYSGETDASAHTLALLEFALSMCEATGGALDITMYPVVRAWGFTSGEYRIPAGSELTALLRCVDYTGITVDGSRIMIPEGSMVDLGSVGKGYASDVIADMLRSGGVDSALIDLGGNIYCIGTKENGAKWTIGLRDPMGGDYLGVVSVSDCAVVTSGCYERYFEQDGVRYGHIFDPVTGCPADNGLISVTIIGKSGAVCDALSTALYVMGPDAAADYLSAQDDADAILVRSDGSLMITADLKGIFTPLGKYEHSEVEWIK